MRTKNVESVSAPSETHWVGDGFRVHNFIPGVIRGGMERMSPFILLDYNSNYRFPPAEHPRGVDSHPHRGFETVTIAYKGKVRHHDNHGGGGIIGEGDVQWMTAASGVLHKEFHEEEWSRRGGDFQMVQLWVNLPAKDKMSKPRYQAITNDRMGKVALGGEVGTVEIIAGEFQGVKGPAFTFTPIELFNARLNKGGKVSFSFPEHYHTAMLVIEGAIQVNDKTAVPTDHFVLMADDGEEFTVSANQDAVVLIMSGEPINEPIAAQGPFVMNTREELMQAYEDFRKGLF